MANELAQQINNFLEALRNLIYLLQESVLMTEDRQRVEEADCQLERITTLVRSTLALEENHDEGVEPGRWSDSSDHSGEATQQATHRWCNEERGPSRADRQPVSRTPSLLLGLRAGKCASRGPDDAFSVRVCHSPLAIILGSPATKMVTLPMPNR